MRILNDIPVIDFLDAQNKAMPTFSIQQIQIHIDYKCGCKITQDRKGNSLFPCSTHNNWAQINRDNKTLHKVIQ